MLNGTFYLNSNIVLIMAKVLIVLNIKTYFNIQEICILYRTINSKLASCFQSFCGTVKLIHVRNSAAYNHCLDLIIYMIEYMFVS